jgi:ATP adenylyltransferase
MSYIGAAKGPAGCVFCEAFRGTDDRKHLVLVRRAQAFLILNLYPYAAGHVMAVINRHVGALRDATASEMADAMELVNLAIAVLTVEYRAEGFNVGINQGRVAGAGILDHLHVHVVPRWNGDNKLFRFMSFYEIYSGEHRVPGGQPIIHNNNNRIFKQRELPSFPEKLVAPFDCIHRYLYLFFDLFLCKTKLTDKVRIQ